MCPSTEGAETFVHQRFRESAAGVEHSANIESLMPALLDVTMITAEVCGNPKPGAAEGAGGRRGKVYTPGLALALIGILTTVATAAIFYRIVSRSLTICAPRRECPRRHP